MLEDRRTALDAIIHPRSAIFFFVERDRGSLATDDRHTFENSDFVFVGVLSERRGARLKLTWSVGLLTVRNAMSYHACGTASYNDNLLLAILEQSL